VVVTVVVAPDAQALVTVVVTCRSGVIEWCVLVVRWWLV
jgi:hypothetical protein